MPRARRARIALAMHFLLRQVVLLTNAEGGQTYISSRRAGVEGEIVR